MLVICVVYVQEHIIEVKENNPQKEYKRGNNMVKEIDIDNKKQIIAECDFDYYYESEECSRELCMFYNDITQWSKGKVFNKTQAKIDLGRIGIVLNRQHKEIEELKKQVQEKDLLYKSMLAMATELNDVYDTEGCMYGDEISGDTPEETANAYIEETKKKLREKNNG